MKIKYVALLFLAFFFLAGSISFSNAQYENSGISVVSAEALATPLITGSSENTILSFAVLACDSVKQRHLRKLEISFTGFSHVESISCVREARMVLIC